MLNGCWLSRWNKERPERIALVTSGVELTWREVFERAAGVASALADSGIGPGSRVAVTLPMDADLFIALHAIWFAGAAAVPIDHRLSESERSRQESSAEIALGSLPSGDRSSLDPPLPAGDDVALVVHTSGTTADPRPIELTYGNIVASANGYAAALGHREDERWLCSLPLSHVGGLMILLRSLVFGTTTVLDPPPFNPIHTKHLLDSERITLISLVPTMLARLLDAGLTNPQHLRCAIIGGAPAEPELLQRAIAAGMPVAPTYGLTQACSQVTIAPPTSSPPAPGLVGFPLPGVDVKIAPDNEILVGGPTVSPSARSNDGFLHTGDLGQLTPQGLLIIGRKSDTIITGGENVAPQEIEAVLLSHPAVEEAAVFGRPHSEWGEVICAKVVLTTPETPDKLQNFCSTHLARFKVPKQLEIVPTLPKTPSGKILRRQLAAEV